MKNSNFGTLNIFISKVLYFLFDFIDQYEKKIIMERLFLWKFISGRIVKRWILIISS